MKLIFPLLIAALAAGCCSSNATGEMQIYNGTEYLIEVSCSACDRPFTLDPGTNEVKRLASGLITFTAVDAEGNRYEGQAQNDPCETDALWFK